MVIYENEIANMIPVHFGVHLMDSGSVEYEYSQNLSISICEGKENNCDSLSSGE